MITSWQFALNYVA